MELTLGSPPAQKAAPGLIKDSDTKNFMADVIEASRQVPVIVDFWAPWCGPCKQLGPAIEKVVRQANGKVKLVKINVDENQQLAGQMRVQSIPAVFAFVNGQPVDGFMGALPESQIKQFVDRLSSQGGMAEQIAGALAEADKALAAGDNEIAADIYGQIVQVDAEHAGALAGLIRSQVALGDLEAAQATLSHVPAGKKNDPAVMSAAAALDLALNPVDTSEVAKFTKAVEQNPNDLQARIDLAIALNGTGDRAAATDHLIYAIKKDRAWNEEAARKQLVKFFEAWGPKDDSTIAGRRKLSSVLFS